MKKVISVLLAGALAIASCKKDDSPKPVKNSQTNLMDGSGGQNDPTPPPPPPPPH